MQSFQGNLVDNNYVESLITADLIDAVVAGYYPSQIIYLNPGQSVNLQMSFRNVANRVWSPSIFGISTFFFAPGYGSTFRVRSKFIVLEMRVWLDHIFCP